MTADPRIITHLLPYHENLETRNLESLDLIVLHCTELPDLQMAREFGERIVHQDSQTGNSGHYYIDRDGSLYRYVEDNRVARHVIGYNLHSLGIEIVNRGRYPDWFSSQHQECTEQYPAIQLGALRELLFFLHFRYPQIRHIARHSDLDITWVAASNDASQEVRRKIDPGPLFPWEEILGWWNSL